MIASWMLSATLFTLLLGVAAYAVEQALRAMGRATRFPWIVALIGALLWPFLAPVVARLSPASNDMPAVTAASGSVSPVTIISAQLPTLSSEWSARVGVLLVVMWVLASTLLLVRLLLAVRTLNRLRRSAKDTMMDGDPVLVTESLGPAVVGLVHPRVAVPAWFLQLDASLRTLVLRHEREHCRSRDPQLVWLASFAMVVVPWNAALWWLSRRLRLALEIDCDARTLRREASPETYGKLLLLMAQRQSGYPMASMLAESNSHLSRRIRAMHQTPLRRPFVRVVLLSGLAAGAIALACSPRIASDLTAPQATAASTLTKTVNNGPVYFEYQVEKPVEKTRESKSPVYPADLRAQKVDGHVVAQFVVDDSGRAEVGTFRVLKSTHAEFTAAVQEALPGMRFTPAMIGDRAVKQLTQQPFVFAVNPAYLEPVKISGGSRLQEVAKPQDAPTEQVRPYFEFQVNKPATPRAGSAMPQYPAALKAEATEGMVLAQFVVNAEGLAEVTSLKVLKSTHQAFVDAVKAALPDMRFEPATVNGKVVKQLVQMPFNFAVPK